MRSLVKQMRRRTFSFRYDQLAYIIADAIQNPQTDLSRADSQFGLDHCACPFNIVGDLFQKLRYPILRSDLRPTKDNSDLALVKVHAQLLQVSSVQRRVCCLRMIVVAGKRARSAQTEGFQQLSRS